MQCLATHVQKSQIKRSFVEVRTLHPLWAPLHRHQDRAVLNPKCSAGDPGCDQQPCINTTSDREAQFGSGGGLKGPIVGRQLSFNQWPSGKTRRPYALESDGTNDDFSPVSHLSSSPLLADPQSASQQLRSTKWRRR